MDTRKVMRKIVIAGLLVVIIIGFFLLNEQITQNRRESFIYVEDSNEYSYQVETVVIEDDMLVIKGWFFEVLNVRNTPRKSNMENEIGVLLVDLEEKTETYMDGSDKPVKGIPLSIEKNIREDINNYYKCEYDYSRCGFTAKIQISVLDLNNRKYQIVFKPDEKGLYGINAKAYINGGQLQYVDPRKEMVLDIKGTDLEEVVEKGYCLVNNLDYHVLVYQYGDKLYWIVDNEFQFENDEGTNIFLWIDTTQTERLPEDRKKNGLFDSIGCEFERNEITNKMNCGKYRVCTIDIPYEYSISYAQTGNSVNGVIIWQNSFRPVFLYR